MLSTRVVWPDYVCRFQTVHMWCECSTWQSGSSVKEEEFCCLGGHSFTCMCAQMSSQCISPTASVIANGTFERLLSWMQFNVAQQVSLLGEGSSTLVTLEWSLPCEHMDGKRMWEANPTGHCTQLILVFHLFKNCLAGGGGSSFFSYLCGYACAPSAR